MHYLLIALFACVAPLCSAAELTFMPFKPGGIYALGEKAGWTVTRSNESAPSAYSYVIRKNNLDEIQKGTLDLSRPARIEVTLNEPAMLYLEVQPGGLAAGAAIAPGQLRPSVPEPPDFNEFWARKIAELQKVPMNAVLDPRPGDKADVEYAIVKMDHVGGHNVHGQLAKPARAGKFPGLVIFQWASPPYPLQRPWVTDRAAEGWLALNIEPHDVLPDQPQAYYEALPPELKKYQEIGRSDRDRNYFLQMYLADYRAVEYLTSRPDWDGKTLIVTGISMGGQQSLCTAAFHPKVTGLVVHVPAGADSNGPLHGRASGYPNWPANDPQVMRTALYFDTVNCAARVKVPALVSMGFIDTVTPPVGIWIAYNQLRGPKEVIPLVDAAHNHQATAEQQALYTTRAAEWLRMFASGRAPK